jgi:hypothetical protein
VHAIDTPLLANVPSAGCSCVRTLPGVMADAQQCPESSDACHRDPCFLKFEFDPSWYGAVMVRNMPLGWPQEVQPPGGEGWEATAVTWLLDLVPEYRQYDMVCRHPVFLASIARHLIHGSVEGAREGYRTVRTELTEHAPPHAVDVALRAYRTEGRRLAPTERAVDLVERALRGGPYTRMH